MIKDVVVSTSELVSAPVHFIDVRAPVEFAEGAYPGAVNLPLLNNNERHLIGVTYKLRGQQAAIELGLNLVQGLVRDGRMQSWIGEINRHPNSVIYCFRGGLRSQTVQAWLREVGCHCPIVPGGYKAMRQFLLNTIIEKSDALEFHVVSGPTGSGKTDYIRASGRPYIDLEHLAAHRGSAFGALRIPQPSQQDFENALALEMIKASQTAEPVLIEDESQMIGQRLIPVPLYQKMQASHALHLNVPLEVRVENILKDYVIDSSLGESLHSTSGNLSKPDSRRFDQFRKAVRAISKRLGGVRTQELLVDLDVSQNEFEVYQRLESNRVWIRKLLEWYYDPYYNFAMARRGR